MTLEIDPTAEGIAVFARGVNLREPLGADVVSRRVAAVDKFPVMVFRDQPPSQAEQIAAAEPFGLLDLRQGERGVFPVAEF